MNLDAPRKIVHLDMDCFYAAVEMRDDPALRGIPLAVAWDGPRGVVLTANYEARAYGVRSALSTRSALRLCPALRLVPPRMEAYRAVSSEIHEVFRRYTDLVEPLSLDEAYLDVTEPKQGPPSGTRVAEYLRREILEHTGLTASAGVSYNKFLAKLASGMNKPDGLTVILPERAADLLGTLPVEAFHGVGPATARRLHAEGVYTGADMREQSLAWLRENFGRVGEHFYEIVRGVDERPVVADRAYKSVSTETTFVSDVRDVAHLREALPELAAQVEVRLLKAGLQARTVVVKLKYEDFRLITRRRTLPFAVRTAESLCHEADVLLSSLTLTAGVRLLGVGAEGLSPAAEAEPQVWLFP